MPELNFNLLAPNAELYSGPDVKLDPMAAYEAARTRRDTNTLAQLYAKHYDPQTGGVNYNALIPEAAQSGVDVSKLMGDVQKQAKSQADIAQTRALQQQEEATAMAKQDEIRREKIKEMATESYGRFRGVKDAESLLAWHLANPELEGTNKAERTAKLQQDLKDKGYEAVRAEIEGSLQAITGIKPEDTGPKFGTYQPGDYTTASWAKFVKTKDPGVLQLKPTASQIAASSAATTVAPKLKPGERWNPELERVEQVPGSAEYIRQSKLHAKDYDAVSTVNRTTDANIANVDTLIAAANAWAAETNNGAKPLGKDASEDAKAWVNLFPGGYSGYLSQLKSGKTASLKGKLDTLLANAKGLGLQGMRVGGSIGAITEKEWPMLAQQIITLRPNMSPADAAALITNVRERFNTTRDLSRDAYDTAWEGTQYHKGAAAAAPPAASSSPETPAPAKTAPKIGDIIKGHKFKGGNPSDPKNWEKVK